MFPVSGFFYYSLVFFLLLFALTPHNEVSSCSFSRELKFLDEPLMPKGKGTQLRESFNSDLKTKKAKLTQYHHI